MPSTRSPPSNPISSPPLFPRPPTNHLSPSSSHPRTIIDTPITGSLPDAFSALSSLTALTYFPPLPCCPPIPPFHPPSHPSLPSLPPAPPFPPVTPLFRTPSPHPNPQHCPLWPFLGLAKHLTPPLPCCPPIPPSHTSLPSLPPTPPSPPQHHPQHHPGGSSPLCTAVSLTSLCGPLPSFFPLALPISLSPPLPPFLLPYPSLPPLLYLPSSCPYHLSLPSPAPSATPPWRVLSLLHCSLSQRCNISLQYLKIGNWHLNGSIPGDIGNLKALTFLDKGGLGGVEERGEGWRGEERAGEGWGGVERGGELQGVDLYGPFPESTAHHPTTRPAQYFVPTCSPHPPFPTLLSFFPPKGSCKGRIWMGPSQSPSLNRPPTHLYLLVPPFLSAFPAPH
ncbi:unnamed protein product [Closterium sp. Naga37s-1]|nr:unnamed protein product [Closterium sp. Naga37s-1]